VNDKGAFAASVSGGCVEAAAVLEAPEAVRDGKPRRKTRGTCPPPSVASCVAPSPRTISICGKADSASHPAVQGETMPSWKRMLAIAFASGAVGFLLSAPAAAQERPCMDDLKKLCPDAKPGTKEALKCLQSHKEHLSDACKARVAKGKRRMGMAGKAREACRSDVEKFCKETPHGGGSVRDCLQQHQADLSAECNSALAAKANKMKAGASTKSN
jgi:Cysteine rich repeat